jgi:hypothetical protein
MLRVQETFRFVETGIIKTSRKERLQKGLVCCKPTSEEQKVTPERKYGVI